MDLDENPAPEAGHKTPVILYGTAWKGRKTAELTKTALTHGFVGVDTANYLTSYDEALTGKGIAAALEAGVERSNLFSIEGQVNESIHQSLEHLGFEYLDALLLQAPFQYEHDNLMAWKVFETYVPHKIRSLGVSNFSLPQLQKIYYDASVKPAFVQNRFFRNSSYDVVLRAFCRNHGITYQAYSVPRHNPEILASKLLRSVSEKLGVEKEVAFYVLVLSLGGIQVLDGTTKLERMKDDTRTVREVFENDQLLRELKPAFVEWRKMRGESSQPRSGSSSRAEPDL